MRSILLVILSFLILVGGFFAYSKLGTKHDISHHDRETGLEPPKADMKKARLPGSPLGPGAGAWMVDYDEKGVLKNRFRADSYLPRNDGKIDVTNPVAEFFMPNHQMMRVIGTDGEVVMPDASGPKTSSTDVSPGAPSRGQINHVIIQIYNMFPDARPNVPDETIYTQDVQFDNVTMLITTESYLDPVTNKLIAADQVPVKMRSNPDNRPELNARGYDFDGRGMRLRWNDKDGRLDLLEIYHGEDLIVKDTSSSASLFGGGGGHNAKVSTTQAVVSLPLSEPPAPAQTAAQAPAQVASAKLPAGAAITSAPASAKPGPSSTAPAKANPPPVPVPYVATFFENVRITQGDEVLITANQMDVDFVNKQQGQAGPTTTPTTGPSHPASANKTQDHASVATGPTTRPTSANPSSAESERPTSLAAGPQIRPATAPTTRPASPPIVIRWTGKLVMMPSMPHRPKVAPGDAIVELTGNPVTVIRTPTGQEGDDVRAAKVYYHTADGSVKLVQSPAIPQVVISKLINGKIDPNTTITTSTLDYLSDAAGKKFALLTGPGHALLPMDANGTKATSATPRNNDMMDAHWQQGAKVYFTGKGQDQMAIEHVDLAGDVDVKHPQLVMKSQALALYFEPMAKPATHPAVNSLSEAMVVSAHSAPTTAPARDDKPQQELKRVVAKDSVHCVVAGQNGKKQTIDCQDLDMRTARSDEGKFYARQINAKGAVHAFDTEQDLHAEIVELTLKPSKPRDDVSGFPGDGAGNKPAPSPQSSLLGAHDVPGGPATQPAKEESGTAAAELEKMIARENVRVINKEGSVATGSELIITTEGNENHVRLVGGPVAQVIDAKKNIITGPLILVEPKQGIAHVVGSGAMHTLQEQADGSKPRPMDVTWIERADMNGPADRVDVLGNVAVRTFDADGTINDAKGERVRIDLMKKPTPTTRPATQPATQPSITLASTQPATRPAKNDAMADSMKMDVMKDKDIRTVTLIGNASVISTLKDSGGKVVRQFALFGPKIIYQLADTKDVPAKTLLVPSAGKMFMGDHRPPEKPKTAEKAKDKDGEDEASNRGDTAFKWSKQLIYSEQERRSIMTGDVLVVHQPEGKEAEQGPVKIVADKVTAKFEPQKRDAKPTTGPATAPATAPAISAPVATAMAPATAPATQPSTRPGRNLEPATSVQLKYLTADGHVVITRGEARLFANRVDYDPITHWMYAHGTENRPARYEDPDPHKPPLVAREMQGNTQTWEMKATESKGVNLK